MMRKDELDRESAEARRVLDDLAKPSGGVFESALRRGGDHFAAGDAPASDGVEIWGRRVGRALGLVFLLILAVNLATGWFF